MGFGRDLLSGGADWDRDGMIGVRVLTWLLLVGPDFLVVLQCGEWPSGLNSLRQVTEVKLGRVRSDFGWVTTEA